MNKLVNEREAVGINKQEKRKKIMRLHLRRSSNKKSKKTDKNDNSEQRKLERRCKIDDNDETYIMKRANDGVKE